MPASNTPPTLAQLRAVLAAVRHAAASREGENDSTSFRFDVDNELLAELGVSFYADAGTLVSSLLEVIERLCFIEQTLGDYSKADVKGTTAADCQAFINNELKNVPPYNGLETTMRRRMYNATLQKLVELGVWRAAVDATRFQNQREAERRRQEELKAKEEAFRKESDRMNREYQERRNAEEDRKRSWGPHGDPRSPPPGGPNPFEDLFRDAFKDKDWDPWKGAFSDWKQQYEQEPFIFGFGKGNSQSNSNRREQARPKARNKERAPWYEVLGVPVNADKATIKSAWRKLASQHQPRTNADALDAAKTEKMKDINTAKDEGLRGLPV